MESDRGRYPIDLWLHVHVWVDTRSRTHKHKHTKKIPVLWKTGGKGWVAKPCAFEKGFSWDVAWVDFLCCTEWEAVAVFSRLPTGIRETSSAPSGLVSQRSTSKPPQSMRGDTGQRGLSSTWAHMSLCQPQLCYLKHASGGNTQNSPSTRPNSTTWKWGSWDSLPILLGSALPPKSQHQAALEE